jgi:hypothetical protein
MLTRARSDICLFFENTENHKINLRNFKSQDIKYFQKLTLEKFKSAILHLHTFGPQNTNKNENMFRSDVIEELM